MSLADPPPPVLYHYTSLEAFRAIMRTCRIRATHYLGFADREELRFGVNGLLDALRRYRGDPSTRALQGRLLAELESFVTTDLDVYVLSLTGEVDSPWHWSKYARRGVAIGFDFKAVGEGFQTDEPRPVGAPGVDRDPSNRLMRCRYAGSFDLQSLVAERFFGPNSYVAAFASPWKLAHEIMWNALAVAVYQVICTIKRESFQDEREWRVVHINPNRDEYPLRRDEKDRPYLSMRFDPPQYVKELWVGPHDNQAACYDAIAEVVDANGLGCKVYTSKHDAVANGGLDPGLLKTGV